MTVGQMLDRYYIENFRIIVYLNNKTEILYDSTKTKYDMPLFLENSIVENVYPLDNGILDIEV